MKCTQTTEAIIRRTGLRAWLLAICVATFSAIPAFAQQVLNFTQSDIGNSGLLSSSQSYTISGSGSSIDSGTSDGFTFVNLPASGDVTIYATVAQPSGTTGLAGVMIRDSLTGIGANAFIGVASPIVGTSAITFSYRTLDGTMGSSSNGTAVTSAVTLKLVLSGSTVTAYQNIAGVWTAVGSPQTIQNLSSSFYVGLALTSGNNASALNNSFTNVALGQTGIPTQTDIQTNIAGSMSYSTVYNLTGAGTGIGIPTSVLDNANFANIPCNGNVEFIANVSPPSGTSSSNAFAGLMIRDSLSPGAGEVCVGITGASSAPYGVNFSYRTSDGSTTGTASGANVSGPTWLRLLRSNGVVSAFQSADGVNWSQIGNNQSVSFPPSCFAGLTICSGTTSPASTSIGQVFLWSNLAQADIGGTGALGSNSSGGYTLTGAGTSGGAGIGGTSDVFSYASTTTTGMTSYTACVSSLSSLPANGFAGLMVRKSLSASDIMGSIGVTASGQVQFVYRTTSGASSTIANGVSVSGPIWLRVTQSGSSFSAYQSFDGVTFTQVGTTQTLSMGSPFYAGFAVSSYATAPSTATFSNVSMSGLPWPNATQSDIGSPGTAGTYFANSLYMVSGSGSGVGGTADNFSYLSSTSTGSAVLTSKITSLPNITANGSAGLMVRASQNANDVMACVSATPSSGVSLSYRASAGTTATTITETGSPVTAPTWLQLVQTGSNNFTAFQSTDGNSWNYVGTCQVPLPSSFLAGVFVASGTPGLVSSVTFTAPSFGQQYNFTQSDIGSTVAYNQQFKVNGAGTGFGGTSDSFSQISIPSTGSISITSLVSQPAAAANIAGLTIRQSLAANSANATVGVFGPVSGNSAVKFISRTTSGGTASSATGSSVSSPVYLRLVFSGSNMSAYQSNDGITYTQIGTTQTISMSGTIYVGLAASSGTTGTTSAANFANTTFGTPAPFGVQGTLTESDIGGPGALGSYSQTSMIAANGNGLVGSADNCTFASINTAGNVEICAQMLGQSTSNPTAIAGLMIRDSLNAGGAEAFVGVTPQNGVNFTYRTADGATSTTSLGPSVLAPTYIRLVRSQNTLAGYQSANGSNWTMIGSCKMTLPPIYYVGLASASGSTGNTANLTNVNLSTSVPQRGNNLAMWIRSDAGVISNSGSVSQLTDQSGLGNNGVQTTVANQPTLNISDPLANNLPSLSFDGSNDYLKIGNTGMDLTQGCSMFVVANPSSLVTNKRFIELGTSSTNLATLYESSTKAAFDVTNSGSGAFFAATASLTTGIYQLIEMTQNSSGLVQHYLNGAAAGSATVHLFTTHAPTANYISFSSASTSNCFAGNLAELFVFNSSISTALRGQLESYIFSKFGVGTEPTLDAPIISPGFGVFTTGQTITISQDQNAVVLYTLDGSNPATSTSAMLYNGPFILNQSATITAVAEAPNFINSSSSTSYVQIEPGDTVITQLNPQLWVRSDNGVTTSGTTVTSWLDLSNNSYVCTPAGSPTLASNQINGFPAISFNGTNQFFTFPQTTNYSAGCTLFFVVQPTGTLGSRRFLEFGNSGTTNNLFGFGEGGTANTADFFNYNSSSAITSVATALTPGGIWQQASAVYDGVSSATINTNATGQSSTNSNNAMNTMANVTRSTNTIGRYLGGSAYFAGEMAEIIVFNQPLTSAQIQAIQGYIAHRYQLYVTTPVITPGAGMYAMTPQTVTMAADPGATIKFTTDGSNPSSSSTASVYSGPFSLTQSAAVQAYASEPYGNSSLAQNAIGIDTSTGNIPTSGQLMWMRSDVGAIPEVNGATATQWLDMSPGGNSCSSGAGFYSSTSSNGFPALNFNTFNTGFVVPASSSFSNLTAGLSAFLMQLTPSTSFCNISVTLGNTGSNNNKVNIAQGNSSQSLNVYNASGTLSSVGAIPGALGNFALNEFFHNGATKGTICVNSSQVAQVSGMFNPANVARSSNSLVQGLAGPPPPAVPQVQEWMLYNRPVTVFEQQILEAYYLQRYQVLPPPISTAAPQLYPAGGTYSGSIQVAMTCAPGATIWYTTNGMSPVVGGNQYYGPITILTSPGTTVVKAIYSLQGFTTGITSVSYTR